MRRGSWQITVGEAMPWDLLKMLDQRAESMDSRHRPGEKGWKWEGKGVGEQGRGEE